MRVALGASSIYLPPALRARYVTSTRATGSTALKRGQKSDVSWRLRDRETAGELR